MLFDLLDRPDEYLSHFERYTDSVTTQLIYGFRAVANGQDHITQFFDLIDVVNHLVFSFSAAILDLYPVLRALPGFLFPATRLAKRHARREKEMFSRDWMEAKSKIQEGHLEASLTSYALFNIYETSGLNLGQTVLLRQRMAQRTRNRGLV